jgi:hypothetical protein
MQVVVSMSLATCGASRTPVGGAGLAEMRLSSMLLGINPRINGETDISTYFHCSLFIVQCSFAIAGAAVFHNDR